MTTCYGRRPVRDAPHDLVTGSCQPPPGAREAHRDGSPSGAGGPDTLPFVLRQCSRPTCSEDATATLTYVYGGRLVFLDLLSTARDPNDYDLCARHADRVRVPNGWGLEDRRSVHARLAG